MHVFNTLSLLFICVFCIVVPVYDAVKVYHIVYNSGMPCIYLYKCVCVRAWWGIARNRHLCLRIRAEFSDNNHLLFLCWLLFHCFFISLSTLQSLPIAIDSKLLSLSASLVVVCKAIHAEMAIALIKWQRFDHIYEYCRFLIRFGSELSIQYLCHICFVFFLLHDYCFSASSSISVLDTVLSSHMVPRNSIMQWGNYLVVNKWPFFFLSLSLWLSFDIASAWLDPGCCANIHSNVDFVFGAKIYRCACMNINDWTDHNNQKRKKM